MSAVHDRAMLVDLNISQWTARRYDKKISKQATDSNNASSDAGRFNKALLSKKSLASIVSTVSSLRTYHAERTLPWGESGSRLLPAVDYLTYVEGINSRKQKFEAAVEAFVTNYQSYVTEAQTRLNNMFNANDYPPVDEIRHKFRVNIHVTPVPQESDFRIDLGDAEVNKIREDMRRRAEAAQKEAIRDLWNRMREVVQNMATRLSNEKSTFRNSLVENISSIVSLLPGLNITNDPDLEVARREIEADLCSMHPSALRTNKTARKQTAQRAQEIANKMSTFMGADK